MISTVTIQILFLFFPGIIGTKLIEFFSDPREKLTNHRFMMNSFILGIISYIPTLWMENSFLKGVQLKKLNLNFLEISLASLVAILVSAIFLFLKRKDYLHDKAKALKLTNHSAYSKVIKAIYHSEECKDVQVSWVNIRYHNSDTCIFGWIDRYSLTEDNIELFLRDVKVYYENKTEPSYEMKATYICTKPENIYIEYF